MKRHVAFFAVVSLVPSLQALPDYEPFADATGSGGTAYSAGSPLVGQTSAQGLTWFQAGASAPTSAIQSGSLAVSGLASAGGNSVLMVPQSNVASRFGLDQIVTGGSLYYSLALNVAAIGTTMGTGGGFIAGFNNSGAVSQATSPSVVYGRVTIRSATGGFNIGTQKAGNVSDMVFDNTVFTTSDTIFLVVRYTFNPNANDDVVNMWINPSALDFGAATPPAPTLTAPTPAAVADIAQIGSFLLYARANTLFPDQLIVDDLRVGQTWADVTPPVPEPATAALMGLGVLGVIGFYRARRR
jgi:hypothetical protein